MNDNDPRRGHGHATAIDGWLPEPDAAGIDLEAVVDQLHDIEEEVETAWDAGRRRRAGDNDGPSIGQLLRRTFDSIPPPPRAGLSADPLFTSSDLYDDMVTAMRESTAPMALTACEPVAERPEDEAPAVEAPRVSRHHPVARRGRFLMVAGACLCSFALGVVGTLALEDRAAPALASPAQVADLDHTPAAAAATLAGAPRPVADSATPSVQPTAPEANDAPDPTAAATVEAETAEAAPTEQASEATTASGPATVAADEAAAPAAADSPPAVEAQPAAEAEPVAEAQPAEAQPAEAAPPELGPFDKAAASAAVAAVAGQAAGCGDGEHSGRAQVSITFAPSGRATSAVVSGGSTLAGTTVGSCIARTMRGAQVPPFAGQLVTVSKTVHVP